MEAPVHAEEQGPSASPAFTWGEGPGGSPRIHAGEQGFQALRRRRAINNRALALAEAKARNLKG